VGGVARASLTPNYFGSVHFALETLTQEYNRGKPVPKRSTSCL
jgi:hypothetical protein